MGDKLFNLKDQKAFRRELRNNMPIAERKLWFALRGKQLNGYKFRRQHGIGSYIVDFYCPAVNLVIELDGDSHFWDDRQENDRARDRFLVARGLRVVRFVNTDVLSNIEGVVDRIVRTISSSPHPTSPRRGEE